MNREQTGQVVIYLNRAGLLHAMEGQAAVWHDAIGHLDYQDSQAAARHLVTTRTGAERWVTPGDIIATVRHIRAARVAGVTAPAPPVQLNVDQDIAWRRAYITARADGLTDQAAQDAANTAHGIEPPALAPAPPRLRALAAQAASVQDRTQEAS